MVVISIPQCRYVSEIFGVFQRFSPLNRPLSIISNVQWQSREIIIMNFNAMNLVKSLHSIYWICYSQYTRLSLVTFRVVFGSSFRFNKINLLVAYDEMSGIVWKCLEISVIFWQTLNLKTSGPSPDQNKIYVFRNPDDTKNSAIRILMNQRGAQIVLWTKRVLIGDRTTLDR